MRSQRRHWNQVFGIHWKRPSRSRRIERERGTTVWTSGSGLPGWKSRWMRDVIELREERETGPLQSGHGYLRELIDFGAVVFSTASRTGSGWLEVNGTVDCLPEFRRTRQIPASTLFFLPLLFFDVETKIMVSSEEFWMTVFATRDIEYH